MTGHREFRSSGGTREGGIERRFDRRRYDEVVDGAATQTNEMVVVADEFLVQFVAGMVLATGDSMDDPRVLQVTEVAVHGALGEARSLLQQLGHARWSAEVDEQIDELSSATRVRQSGCTKPIGDSLMDRLVGTRHVHERTAHGRDDSGRLASVTKMTRPMKLSGDYVPSTSQWVRDQVDLYERTNGREGNTLRDTGIPVVIVSMRGAKSGSVRKIALMRVEHQGEYLLVASKGGAPEHPDWYHNLIANPEEVTLQDGPEPFAVTVRLVDDSDYEAWWQRAVAVFAPYAQYREKTSRRIPLFVASPVTA